jgi:serine-type D-Ala-D-Ala carboxypeptidase (penicillin-binding protein 5/6)
VRRRLLLVPPPALAALLLATLAGLGRAGAAPAAPIPAPRAVIVVDAGDGQPLLCDNAHGSVPPASTAKIMTALVAAERLPPNKMITVNGPSAGAPEQEIGFAPGQKLPFDKLLASLMMMSANDAAYALAYATSGGLDKFADAAASTARRLGMKESTFNDPSGLDTDQAFEGGPRMSAFDLAIVTRNALEVPAIAKWASTREYDFTAPGGAQYHLVNHNRMLPGGSYAYPGATGFKTGFTDLAQHSIVATATRNGHTLIAVVLGSVVPGGYAPAAAALDAGFAVADHKAPIDAECRKDALPPNNVSLYASRAADRDGFALLRGSRGTQGGAAGFMPAATPVVPPSIPNLSEPPRAAPPVTTVVAKARSDGLLTVRNGVVVLIVLLVICVLLRRRAVRRKRAQRAARARQRAAAMRSGSLPVVDGRYRPGMRLGKPVESHVRVTRDNGHAPERSRLG